MLTRNVQLAGSNKAIFISGSQHLPGRRGALIGSALPPRKKVAAGSPLFSLITWLLVRWIHLNCRFQILQGGGQGWGCCRSQIHTSLSPARNGGKQLRVESHRAVQRWPCNNGVQHLATSCTDPWSLVSSIFKVKMTALCKVVVELNELMCMKILISSGPSKHDSND